MTGLLEQPIDAVLADGSARPAPAVVVEYRDRGVPVPVFAAALVLCAAQAVALHRRLTPPAELTRGYLGGAKLVAGAGGLRTQRDAPRPSRARMPAQRPGGGDCATAATPRPSLDRACLPPQAARGGQATATKIANSLRAPGPTPDDIERAIARESEERAAELDAMSRLKRYARWLARRDAERRSVARRAAFHRMLTDIVSGGGDHAGERIEALCAAHCNEPDPVAPVAASSRATQGGTIRDRVIHLRAYGVAEAVILEELARFWDRRLRNARGGLRDIDDARIKAARQLLAIPLPIPAADRPPGR